MGKSTISMAIFNSKLLNFNRKAQSIWWSKPMGFPVQIFPNKPIQWYHFQPPFSYGFPMIFCKKCEFSHDFPWFPMIFLGFSHVFPGWNPQDLDHPPHLTEVTRRYPSPRCWSRCPCGCGPRMPFGRPTKPRHASRIWMGITSPCWMSLGDYRWLLEGNSRAGWWPWHIKPTWSCFRNIDVEYLYV